MSSTDERAIAMLETALEMERQGKTFYDQAIATCSHSLGKEIFTTLMKDEVLHLDRIKEIYDALTRGDGWTDVWRAKGEGHANLTPFFLELARKTGPNIKAQASDIEAIDVGIGFEQQSVAFYQTRLPKATEPLERVFLEKMVVEEKSHFAVLTEMKYYLTNPAAYFAEKERAGYDGA